MVTVLQSYLGIWTNKQVKNKTLTAVAGFIRIYSTDPNTKHLKIRSSFILYFFHATFNPFKNLYRKPIADQKHTQHLSSQLKLSNT
jgi:hypothetical protein